MKLGEKADRLKPKERLYAFKSALKVLGSKIKDELGFKFPTFRYFI